MEQREVVNPKTGEHIVCTLSIVDAISALKAKNKKKSSNFIAGLISSYEKYNNLSDSQWFWFYKLAQESDETKTVKLTAGFTKSLIDSFISSDLKFPALHLTLCKIYLYGGQLRVKRDNVRCGYIEDDVFYLTREVSNKLIEFIVELSKNPFEYAASEGKIKGICCFCNRELTNNESVFRGYGPICADRYNLVYDYSKQNTYVPLGGN